MGHDRFENQTDPSNGMNFSTVENDNDKQNSHNCAAYNYYINGWWYHSCTTVTSTSNHLVLLVVQLTLEMKICPKECIIQPVQ